MSFTEDELQSFNTILDQRLSAQRKEMERFFDQRIMEARRENEQRFFAMQQELVRNMTLKLTEMQGRLDSMVSEKLQTQQTRLIQSINQDAEQRNQQIESGIARQLETQLPAIEQVLKTQLPAIEELLNKQFEQFEQQSLEETVMTANGVPSLEAFEVQTEIPWEDLSDMIGKALDERLSALNEAISRSLQNLEQYLSVRIHGIRDEFVRTQSQSGTLNGNLTSVQEVLHGIEHLERVVESLQVAMTANHALLSNRLYHHQQLPLERAHPGGHALYAAGNGQANALTMAKERIARGLEPESTGNVKVEEHQGL